MSLQCFHSAAATNNSKLHYYSFYKKQKRFFYLKSVILFSWQKHLEQKHPKYYHSFLFLLTWECLLNPLMRMINKAPRQIMTLKFLKSDKQSFPCM